MNQIRSDVLHAGASVGWLGLLFALGLLGSGNAVAAESMQAMASGSGCLACHGVNNKIVGPALHDIATRYQGKPGAAATLATKVRVGGQGSWGNIPMPPQNQLSEAQASQLVDWILGGAK